jgi:integrase
MLLRELIAAFLDDCRLQGRSPHTMRQYQTRLRSLDAGFGGRDVADLRPLELKAWLAQAGRWPDGREKSPDTRRANAIALQLLQRFAVDNRELDAPIVDKLDKPAGRIRDRLPTPQETERILAAASPAFRLFYRALRLSGARPNELARATVADIDRTRRQIVLKEHKTARKTGAPRRIPLGTALTAVIAQACAGRRSGHLFLSPRGRPWTIGNLDRTFAALRRRCGLPRELVLYCTRHEHGTQLATKRGIQAAAEALGHKSLATTRRYVHTDDLTLRDNQESFIE